jgi:hypothetical protein
VLVDTPGLTGITFMSVALSLAAVTPGLAVITFVAVAASPMAVLMSIMSVISAIMSVMSGAAFIIIFVPVIMSKQRTQHYKCR